MVSMSGLLFEVREISLSNNLKWGRTRDDIVHIYQQDTWLVKIGERKGHDTLEYPTCIREVDD